MKYNNREVQDLSVHVKLGKNYVDDFRENQLFVAHTLNQNKIIGWSYTEAIYDDVILIACKENSIEAINKLFIDVKKVFDKASISVFYDDFGEFDYNEEFFEECLDISLCEE